MSKVIRDTDNSHRYNIVTTQSEVDQSKVDISDDDQSDCSSLNGCMESICLLQSGTLCPLVCLVDLHGCWLLDLFCFFVVLPLGLPPLLRPLSVGGRVVVVVGREDTLVPPVLIGGETDVEPVIGGGVVPVVEGSDLALLVCFFVVLPLGLPPLLRPFCSYTS